MQILMICDCWIRGVWEPIKKQFADVVHRKFHFLRIANKFANKC